MLNISDNLIASISVAKQWGQVKLLPSGIHVLLF